MSVPSGVRCSFVSGAVAFIGAFAFLAASSAAGDGPAASGDLRQDGRLIPRLRWTAPHDEQPGTYAEYLAARLPQSAQFQNERAYAPDAPAPGSSSASGSWFAPGADGTRGAGGIALLIDHALYGQIHAALPAYITDLQNEGYSVFSATVSGGTPEQIKDWVRQRYAAGDEGVVFIGDITAAWAEVSGDAFPCDLFYMDLDGTWADLDHNGTYETHAAGSGDEGPEVYVARLNAHTLNYATEGTLVSRYFAKARQCRIGRLTQPWRGLEYVDEDWFDMNTALGLAYTSVMRHDFGYFTTASDYLDQMDLGQHFVQVCAHSYSGGHHFGKRPTEACAYAHIYVRSPAARQARLRLGSDDGLKVWLNGASVLTRDVYQSWTADQFIVTVNLAAGWNRLLCKVSQGGGDYKLSACFTDLAGVPLEDLEYQVNDPERHGAAPPLRMTYIGTWLLNGAYANASQATRLSQDYLGDEAHVRPSDGDPAPLERWRVAAGEGCPFDLGRAFDTDGGWVFSETVQDCDPPVLFYSLFACGPGRFTDQNYLGGAYIFNTTWGLITLASSKSGSMLNFHDFTSRLGWGWSVGQAFRHWFDAQAPYEQWEREWYYGMILNGDPTLRPTGLARVGDLDCNRQVDFNDINPFVVALSDWEEYERRYPGCPACNADINGDGRVDFRDVNPFVVLLTGR
ncbi:MAG: hypothetical protein AB1716_07735 [Planctomycetota bacterium]